MAKAIMVQGTMSNAGKSLFTTGLCRIFKQDGYKVAPFKSQNMALNSFITLEGLEMGRAQVVQAEAAGLEPSVLMNPILLKPTSDKGSQVIVNGEVLGNMSAEEYFEYKSKLIPDIQKAFDTLARDNDLMVIEGAGSPAEINLKHEDIVNMGMAKMANAPVLLVADIDRGGVFASIYGTMMLLEEEERKYIKGIVINKFRGDVEILKPGLRMIEERVNIPVIGVVPYLKIDIEDEDSLSERLLSKNNVRHNVTNHSNHNASNYVSYYPNADAGNVGLVDIAVIQLPRISNFTDFNVFELLPQVCLRYVQSPADLGHPDMIILPGTKNTMGDLLWLRQNGIEGLIKKQAAQGTVIFGVCGGYQMLGKTLEDPDHVEHGGSLTGMGLLDIATTFAPNKTRTRVSGRFQKVEGILEGLTGLPFSGYEIHMGLTEGSENSLTLLEKLYGETTNKADGSQKHNVMGSYVHGIFDEDNIALTIIQALWRQKGMDTALDQISFKEYKERQYDLLAQEIRKSVDIKALYRILEEGV